MSNRKCKKLSYQKMSDLERRSRVNRCIQGPLEYFDGAFRKDSKWFLALKYVGKKSPS